MTNPTSPSPSSQPRKPRPESLASQVSARVANAFIEADQRWESANRSWKERQVAVPWPPGLLEAFCMRMGAHGLSVSQVMMMCDRNYALQQLVDAHSLADDGLRLMAVQLFRFFEARQAGRAWTH